MFPGFYRLIDGQHAGRVIIWTLCVEISGKESVFFADSFTHCTKASLADVKGKQVGVRFQE